MLLVICMAFGLADGRPILHRGKRSVTGGSNEAGWPAFAKDFDDHNRTRLCAITFSHHCVFPFGRTLSYMSSCAGTRNDLELCHTRTFFKELSYTTQIHLACT